MTSAIPRRGREAVTIDRRDFDAAIFDLDGVLTETAGLHATAWKAVFDAFLQRRAKRQGVDFRPFDIQTDYLDYVDGRPRYDGIRSFLAARGITLPEGSSTTARAQIRCTPSVSARRDYFGRSCKKESLRQPAPKRF